LWGKLDVPQSYSGATTIISSRQCLGGGGSSSGANVNFSSTPQTSHRYLTFTFRSSPASGGATGGRDNARSIPTPIFHTTTASSRPARTHSTLPTPTASITVSPLPIIPTPCGGQSEPVLTSA